MALTILTIQIQYSYEAEATNLADMVLVLKSLSEKVSRSFVLRFPAVQVSLCFRSVLAARHHDITVSLVAAKTSRRRWTTWAG